MSKQDTEVLLAKLRATRRHLADFIQVADTFLTNADLPTAGDWPRGYSLLDQSAMDATALARLLDKIERTLG